MNSASAAGSAARTVPLSAITDRRDLDLRVLVAPVREQRVRWAVVSELPEPLPYLRGQELVLTCGINLDTDPEALRRYVASLVRAGVSALGFGVTPVHDTVPGGLADLCREHGLPLLEVPRATPFVAVSQAVGAALEDDHLEDLRWLNDAHRALARAASGTEPVLEVLRTLARTLQCWALLDGTPRLAVGAVPPNPAGDVADLLAKLREPRGPRSAKTRVGSNEVFLHAVGDAAGPVLLLGRPSGLTMPDRAVLGTGLALLGLLLRDRTGRGELGGLLTRLLLALDGRPSGDLLDRLAATAVPHGSGGQWRVLLGERARPGTETDAARAADVLRTGLVDSGPPGLHAVVPDRGDLHADELQKLLRLGWLAVASRPVGAADLASAHQHAQALLARARAAGNPIVWEEGSGLWEALFDPGHARQVARDLLGPLADAGEQPRILRDTLRVWLSHHGNWDRTAASLGSHRNSVRYRLGRVERDLGMDLSDPEQRMRLWFALQWWQPEP